MTPTPTPLAIPVKRLLRTQGISSMREKSENESLCTPKSIRQIKTVRSEDVPSSLHERRSMYHQKFQRFQRILASLGQPTWAWTEFAWGGERWFSHVPSSSKEAAAVRRITLRTQYDSMQRPGLTKFRNRTPALQPHCFSTEWPLSNNRSKSPRPVPGADPAP